MSDPWCTIAWVIIKDAMERLGATFADITWYHGSVAITANSESLSPVDAGAMAGPIADTIPSIKNDDGEYLNLWLGFGYLDQEQEYY
mmetsp:Transcript_22433/g.25865  ORF Transcript_22433/g.25865 Transcript_22433/m.25865 type:complete len:87 (+) Transcript_22433:51-311(+)